MFITTTDQETAIQLKKLGYVLLSEQGNRWTFLNDPNKYEDTKNMNSVHQTNILPM